MTENVGEIFYKELIEICPDAKTAKLDPRLRIRDQIQFQSIDFLDLVMKMREIFEIDIPDDDYIKLSSMDDWTSYIKEEQGKRS